MAEGPEEAEPEEGGTAHHLSRTAHLAAAREGAAGRNGRSSGRRKRQHKGRT